MESISNITNYTLLNAIINLTGNYTFLVTGANFVTASSSDNDYEQI
jgi:hypothetical protein